MPLHEMPAEFLPGSEWPFQIDARARFHLAKGGAFERFGRKIGGKDFAREFHDGEATAIHSDAAGDGQRACERSGVNAQAAALRALLDGLDAAYVLDDTCKQGLLLAS
jgi:hypothetical protein